MAFSEILSKNRFLKLVELRPPKGVVMDELVEVGKRLHGRSDAVLVPDNPGAVMSLCPIPLGRRLVEIGHEVVFHISCRDRNRIALQSHLLGAYAEGLRTVLVSRGTDPAYGDHPRARAIHDLEPKELVAVIDGFSEGFDESGTTVEGRPKLVAGLEVNPFAQEDALEVEIETARKGIEAGARFLFTTPVHDGEGFRPLAERLKSLGVPVIARVILLKSVGMARYLNTNVVGTKIPDSTIKRLRKAPDKGAESLAIAADLPKELDGPCHGVCFVPLGWEGRLPALLDLM